MPTELPSGRDLPRFAGIATFCRFPRVEDVAPASRPLDWVLFGVPFDGGVTYRPGARFGPRAIREASQYAKPYHLELDVNVAERWSIADVGDAPVRPYDCSETHVAIRDWVTRLPDPETARPFAVGGDHSIAHANAVAAFARRRARGDAPAEGLACLHFDAHLDTVDSVWGERHGHASPFIRAIEDGAIDPTRMISIGIRGPLNTADDLAFARDHGVTIVTAADVRAGTARPMVDAWRERVGERATYLSFDIDCVDPAFAPGTGTPAPGGPSSGDVLDILRACAGLDLAGADLVEVLPDRDPSGITAQLAAQLLIEVLALGGACDARA